MDKSRDTHGLESLEARYGLSLWSPDHDLSKTDQILSNSVVYLRASEKPS